MTANSKSILVGNIFPLNLIRRRVIIEPVSPEELRSQLALHEPVSFWGHESTLPHANALLGKDITPAEKRPALELNDAGLPVLEGQEFDECWVLSPVFAPGVRPGFGEEVGPEQIERWQVLKLQWNDEK